MNQFIELIKFYESKNCLTYNGITYTYKQVYENTKETYEEIKLKIPENEVVALLSDYNLISISLLLALHENKNIIIPITTIIENEIDERLKIVPTKYKILVSSDSYSIDELVYDVEKNSLISKLNEHNKSGLVLFSSGSTGKPKAMIHDLNNLIEQGVVKSNKSRELVFMIFLMFDHIGGINSMLNCLGKGMHMVIPETRNPDEICRLIEKYKINVLPTSPTFLNLIIINESYKKFDLSSIKLITYGTEVMPDSLLIKLKSIFKWVKFIQTFGTSETGISQTSSKSSESTYIRIDDPNTEFKIVFGELYLKTKTQVLGYINGDNDRFTEDGWFKTGDIVEQLEDGYIKIVGRNKEIINVGGEKVLPSEVESILLEMPEVLDCSVFGEQNPITGQMVCAKVLFAQTVSRLEAKNIVVKFCTGKIDKYKIPAKVVLMSESEYTERFKKKRL